MEEGDADKANPVIGSFMRVANNVLDGNVTNVPHLDPLLFTPATGRSKCWRHFAFRTIKGYIDKSRAICRWCTAEIKNVGNTTNLQNHLRRHHVKEVDSDDIGVGDRRSTSPSSSAGHQSAASNPVTTALAQLTYFHNNPYNMENPRSKQVTQAILDYFISNMRPLSTMENEAFLGLFTAVDPMYNMFTFPNVTQLERLLQEKYQVQKAVIGHTMEPADCATITVENCKLNNNCHIVLSASFITTEWQLFSKTLEAFDITEFTEAQVEKKIIQTAKEWNLTAKKVGLVSETEYALDITTCGSLSVIEQYIGFEKTLGNAASCAYILPEVATIIGKVRQCMTRCQNDPQVKAAIDAVSRHRDGPRVDCLVRDNADNWTSTLRMLQLFKQHRSTLKEAIHITTGPSCDLSGLEIKQLDNILEVLQPLLTVAEALSEEVLPSIALILPLYNHLLQTYSNQAEQLQKKESNVQRDIAIKLAAVLNECQFNSIDTLKVATVIDPRFKGLQFMPTKDMREYAYNRVSHAASQLADAVTENNSNTPLSPNADTASSSSVTSSSMKGEADYGQLFDQPLLKKIKIEAPETTSNSSSPSSSSETCSTAGSKSRAMSALFGSVLTRDTLKSPIEKAENEMHRYRAEEQLALDGDPLRWWRSHEASYPLLSQLAKQYLCVPATCTSPKQLFAGTRDSFSSKLNSVEPHLLNTMIFLNRNT